MSQARMLALRWVVVIGGAWLCLTTQAAWGQYAPVVEATFPGTCDDGVVGPTCYDQGFWVRASALAWRPHKRGMDYAISHDNTALQLGRGSVHNLELDRAAGVRAEVGYQTSAAWGVAARITSFDTDGAASTQRPAIANGRLFASRSQPGDVEEAETAQANGSLDYDVYDLEISRRLLNEPFFGLGLFGGLRWARIEQEMLAAYDGRDFDMAEIHDLQKLDAFGIRFGAEGHWRMAGGFSLFGRGGLGMLYGRGDVSRTEIDMTGAVTPDVLVDVRDSFDQAIFNTDVAAGISWTHNALAISGGYELHGWSDADYRFQAVDEIGVISSVSNSLLLEGFFLRAAHTW